MVQQQAVVLEIVVRKSISKMFVFAQVAELVDALASGASVRMDVEVQVLSWAPYEYRQQ